MDHNKNKSSDRLVPISKKDLSKKCWGFKATIRHGQCDPAGIAYTPKLFDLLNVTVEEWYSSCLSINYYEIIGDRRTGLGYVKASADFFQPCFLGDELEICPMINRIGTSSLSLNLHAFNNDVERFRGHLITVATDLESHKSIKLPNDILEALNAYKSNCE